MLRSWEALPDSMRTEAVRPYYEILRGKRTELAAVRAVDIVLAAVSLTALLPVSAGIAAAILFDDGAPVIFSQERITQYCRPFRMYKFRTMRRAEEKRGLRLTSQGDDRVTRTGNVLRRLHLDEIPQLLNVLKGEMTLVGTRPEVAEYVSCYSDEMMATLLLPAGITSEASIAFRDESEMLSEADNVEEVYINRILPAKMKINLDELKKFSVQRNMHTIFRTVTALCGAGSFREKDSKVG